MRDQLRLSTAALLLTVLPATPAVAGRQPDGRLVIIVLDATGALVPHAAVRVTGIEAAGRADADTALTFSNGEWAARLAPGIYAAEVTAAGFRTARLERLAIGRGLTRRTVRLTIAPIVESVSVARDRQSSALDPRGFSTFLSREQIDALPDDPGEFSRVLRDLAPPGAIIRIDGFAGGPMPPKTQILSIRMPRLQTFAAEEHGSLDGFAAIDIVTRPGGGRLQIATDLTARSGALTARSVLASSRAGGNSGAAGLSVDGPLVRERLSFAAGLRLVARNEEVVGRAILPGGIPETQTTRQPTRGVQASARVTSVLGREQTLRASVTIDRRSSARLGLGQYNLESRAYDAFTAERALRVAFGGPWGRRRFTDSRLQITWNGSRNVSAVEAPAVQVLEAFAAGGAQVTGGARAFRLLGATDIDHAQGAHAWRAGVLFEYDRYHSSRRANYFGTYTFSSLAAYEAGRPSFFTRRAGDARVDWSDARAGAYIQDDYRLSRSVLLSYGARLEWQNLLGRGTSVLPRAALTWSPRATGTPTLRASAGTFRDWLEPDVYERALTLDGVRLFDERVADPAYPSEGPPQMAGQSARERYELAPGLRPSMGAAVSMSVDHRLGRDVRVSGAYSVRRGWGRLRGQNLNPIVDGRRLDDDWGNIIRAVDDAAVRAHVVTIQSMYTPPHRRLDAAASYVFSAAHANSAGAFAVPPAGASLRSEWGPVGARHAATVTLTGRLARWTIALTQRWRSGQPYTITEPDSADGLFNTRPAGARRSGATGPAQWDLGARVAWAVGSSGVPEAGRPADGLMGPRAKLEIVATIQNLANQQRPLVLGGVAGSPLFGQPLATMPPRSMDIGLRLAF